MAKKFKASVSLHIGKRTFFLKPTDFDTKEELEKEYRKLLTNLDSTDTIRFHATLANDNKLVIPQELLKICLVETNIVEFDPDVF